MRRRSRRGSTRSSRISALGAAKLVALHHPDNRCSQRAHEKLGIRHTHHELYPPTGLQHVGYELEIGASTGRLAP